LNLKAGFRSDIPLLTQTTLQIQLWQKELSQLLNQYRCLEVDISRALNLINTSGDVRDFDLAFDLNLARSIVLALGRNRALILSSNMARPYNLALKLNRNLAFDYTSDLTFNRDFNCPPIRDLSLALALNYAHARNHVRALDLIHTLNHNLAQDFARALDLARARVRARNPVRVNNRRIHAASSLQENYNFIRSYLLLISIFWALLTDMYTSISRKHSILQSRKLNRKAIEPLSQECKSEASRVFRLYAFLALIDQRIKGEMPAWEGIRIVRERID
jgi:hypothetical protein